MPAYSARNPIPNAKQFADNLQQRLNIQKSKGDGGTQDDHDQAADNRRTVVDPVTKSNVIIQDIKGDFKKSVRKPEVTIPLANIEPQLDPPRPNEVPGADMEHFAVGFGEKYRRILDELAPPEANQTVAQEFPQHDKKRNVLYYRKPSSNLQEFFTAIEESTTKLTVGVIAGTLLLNFIFVGGRFMGIFASILSGLTISVALHLWLRRIQHEANDRNWDTEKARAEAAITALVPESVEWLNSLIGTVWKLINPEMFQAVADTLEDVMQASVPPSVIENVKVADINQGSNPLKILSLRSLPDATQNENLGVEQSKEEIEKKKKERQLEDDPNSRYYNLEASFAYHALPATGVASKAQNIHLEIAFYLGIRGLFGVPLPIFAELQGIVGTVRLRFQAIPTPPFVKNMTMTFMGLPKLSVSVVPMTQKGLNVLDLPLISKFVDNAIGAAIDEYVAPKSLSLDISKLIEGDAVKKETDALGCFYIKIHNAKELPAMDKGGGSDTYITIAFSKLSHKPAYCTRVIRKDLNPSWEEDTCILVHREQLVGGEKLSVQLWDSDRVGKDDKVGSVEFDFHDIIEKEGEMQVRKDKLVDKDGKDVPGELNWEVGFFRRTKFKEAMRTTGEDVRIPKSLRGRDEFKDPVGVTNNAEEALAVNVPPDPTYPSGVVSVIIQEIDHLELERVKGTFGKSRQYSPAQQFGENKDEEGSNLPSSYCTVMVNDTLAFKTRTKVNSSHPIFSAEVERFVRDWRNTIITIGVRDSRHREHDPLIGACSLKLSDVLQTSSQVTRSYALDGGVGYGMINVSVLFRSISLQLPKNLLGWDVGSIEMMKDEIMLEPWSGNEDLATSRIVLKSDVGSSKILRKWAVNDKYQGWNLQSNTIRVPVRQRYGSALRLEFYSRGRRKPVAYAIQWLTDINDNENTTVTLPIWKTKNADSLLQNYVEGYDQSIRDNVDGKQAGEITFTFRFKDGLDESHRHYMQTNDDRETMDAFEACLAEGSRRRIVRRETSATVKKLVKLGLTGENPDTPDDRRSIVPSLMPTGEGTDTDSDYDEDESPRKHQYQSGAQRETESPQNAKPVLETTEQEKQVADEWTKAVIDVVDDDDFSDDEETTLKAGDDVDVQELKDLEDMDGSDSDETMDSQQDPDAKRVAKERKMSEKRQQYRKQRGVMQWKPARNLAFFKDELKIGALKVKNKFGLTGRAPDVETEISQAQ